MAEDRPKIDVREEESPAASRPAGRTSPLAALRGEIDRLFDEIAWPEAGAGARRGGWLSPWEWRSAMPPMPAIDLVEKADAFEIEAELPGMGPEEVEVRVSDGSLVIKGEKTASREDETDDRRISERSYGAFRRSLRLPPGIDVAGVEARMTDGVLKLRVPKTEEARDRERRIEIARG